MTTRTVTVQVPVNFLYWISRALPTYAAIKQAEGHLHKTTHDNIVTFAAVFDVLNTQQNVGMQVKNECLEAIEQAAGFSVYELGR